MVPNRGFSSEVPAGAQEDEKLLQRSSIINIFTENKIILTLIKIYIIIITTYWNCPDRVAASRSGMTNCPSPFAAQPYILPLERSRQQEVVHREQLSLNN